MLRFWKSFTLHGYQVNQDDEDPTLFYIIPSRPTIGLAGSGDGVLAFNFRKYRFADAVADGRKGGGYLMFDVSLEVPPADLELVSKALKDQYAAATAAKPIDDVTDAKLIKLSPAVPFTDAHVTLNIGKDDKTGFVESVTSLGRPSSDGRYTVSFSAALGPEGATYFENAMKGNRQYFSFGAGFSLNVVQLDAAYMIATAQNSPLDQTLRFSLTFDMDGLKHLLGKK